MCVSKNSRLGFSLMELLIAIAILGVIAALVGPGIINYYRGSQVKAAKLDLKTIKEQISLFQIDTGVYPTTLNDLVRVPSDPAIAAKWLGGVRPKKGGYLEKIKKDPWGSDYVYRPEPDKDNPFTLYSIGSDKKQRISVWDLD